METDPTFPQTNLSYDSCDRYAKSNILVEDGSTYLQIRNLPVRRSRKGAPVTHGVRHPFLVKPTLASSRQKPVSTLPLSVPAGQGAVRAVCTFSFCNNKPETELSKAGSYALLCYKTINWHEITIENLKVPRPERVTLE